MKMRFGFLVFLFSFVCALSAHALELRGNKVVGVNKASWKIKENVTGTGNQRPEVTARMKDTLNGPALRNIEDAEQAFCYTVAPVDKKSKVYMLHTLEVTGFCGTLSQDEINSFIRDYLADDSAVSNIRKECKFEPKIALRFVRGIDTTDVLISSPCHSFAVIYAGINKPFNASPASNKIDALISKYNKKRKTFISPSLLKQVVPVGQAKTEEDQKLIKEKRTHKAVRNWEKNSSANSNKKGSQAAGWSQLNLGNN